MRRLHLHPSSSILLLLLFFTPPTCPHPLSTSLLSTDHLTTYDIRTCDPKENPSRPSPLFTDCTAAIALLPPLTASSPFHNGPPDDPFQLPVEKTSGTCTVRVELRGSSRVVSSWARIVASLRILNIVCLWGGDWNEAGITEIVGGVRMEKVGRLFAVLEFAGG